MKLSIIVPVYKESKLLDKFLKKMTEQSSKNFELVLVVDTSADGVLDVVQDYSKKLDKKIKLIFNEKRSSRSIAIHMGAKEAKGDYSIIMSTGNHIDKDFISTATAIIKTNKSDIIEFRAKFASPIRFDGKIRKTYSQPTEISEHPEIIAFTYPFDFNKIIKTSTLQEGYKFKIPVELNSRYSIDVVYLTMLVAKTYSTVNKTLVVSKSEVSENFNPLKMIRQWESLQKVMTDFSTVDFKERLNYAQYFAQVMFMASITKASRNKVLDKKLNDKFKKQNENEFKDLFQTNKYMKMRALEYRVMLKSKKIEHYYKAHKELG